MNNLEISEVFEKLAKYETIREREFPSITFHRYSKTTKFMKSWIEDEDERIVITTNYGNTKLGESSSSIFKELINTGICKRLIEYERTYGILNSPKTDDKRISYSSAKSIVDYINNILSTEKINKNIKFDSYVTGSFRREKSTIGDLDYIIVNFDENERSTIIDMFLSIFDKVLVSGNKKVSGIFKSIQVDVRFIENKQFPCMLLHSTGSAEHNIKLRKIAKSLGMKLNEYCITNSDGLEIYPKSEKEIFDILGIQYVEPKYR